MPCDKCREKQRNIGKPKDAIEVTTDAIKDDRKKFNKDIIQSFRDKQLSKEYVKAYPSKVKEMLKEKHITEQEVKEAKEVWHENHYYEGE
jgi:hypothetical protein